MKENVYSWLSGQKPVLDSIIANAGKKFAETYGSNPNFQFDAQTCSREMGALSKSGDLCYDRPAIGFCYSLWYHGNRVSSLLGFFEDALYEARDNGRVEIYDLGAGTGAIQWAVGLVYCAFKKLGIATPALRVVNIDSSPFMLDYNSKYLWPLFVEQFPEAREIEVEYSINNWVNQLSANAANNWVCASYVFDHTENRDVLSEDFKKLISRIKPAYLMLFTSSQHVQKEYVASLTQKVVAEGYQEMALSPRTFYYNGPVQEVNTLRNDLQKTRDLGFYGTPSWNLSSVTSKLFRRSQAMLPLKVDAVKIYQAAEINRIKVLLTEEQDNAAAISSQPAMIVGPAGCGKSVVLTERIKRIVEQVDKPYDPELRILVTTFNKQLVKVLGDWIETLLDKNKVKRKFFKGFSVYRGNFSLPQSEFTFVNSSHPNISILHFDVLPTIVGKLANRKLSVGEYETYHRELMKEAVDEYFREKGLKQEDHVKISDVDFLLEEFERILYGMQITKRAQYMSWERVGRGNNPTLKYGTERRMIVYDCIHKYLKKLTSINMENFYLKRSRFLKKLNAKEIQPMFTHILVDELQDCTWADHQIFQKLLLNPNNLVLAGDLAQSIQLGAAYHVPVGEDMKKFKRIKLTGSFRLPFRISSSLKGLSEKINKRYGAREGVEAEIIVPYRGAQPGSRPVLVYAASTEEMGTKISAIIKSYASYGITSGALFERDRDLQAAIQATGLVAQCEIILRAKGLEYPCVIWSSRILANTKLEQEEFAYTIFTRTSCILIVAIFDEVDSKLKDIIKMFDVSKSVVWDQATFDHLAKLRQESGYLEEDDSDNTSEVQDSGEDSENFDSLV